MKSDGIVFGIDAGGTSSRLIIARASSFRRTGSSEPIEILASAEAGAANINTVGDEGLERAFRDLFDRARAEAVRKGFDPKDGFVSGCVGAAGAGRAGEKERVEKALRDVVGPRCALRVVGDHEIALAGGLRSDRGFILIAGTGSVAYARSSDGRSFRAGGLGHWLGDEGSAFAVSFQALARGLRSIEGRDLPTSMLDSLLKFYGLASAEEAVPFVYGRFDKALFASAAGLVAEWRDAGDPLAVDIYGRAVKELLLLCRSVRDRAADSVDDKRILFWGGMLENDARLRSGLSERIEEELGDLSPVTARGTAVEGACFLAAAAADGPDAAAAAIAE